MIRKFFILYVSLGSWLSIQAIPLSNSSFEDGIAYAPFFGGAPDWGTINNWGTFETSFSEVSGNQNVSGSGGFWSGMTPLDGTDALYIVSNNENDGDSVYQQVTLTGGTPYRFTVGLGTNSAVTKSNAKFGVVFYSDSFSSQLAATTGTIVQATDTFVDYSVDYTPATTGTYFVGIRNLGYVPGTSGDNNQSTLFVDNARLGVIPEPSTFLLVGLFGFAVLLSRGKLKR